MTVGGGGEAGAGGGGLLEPVPQVLAPVWVFTHVVPVQQHADLAAPLVQLCRLGQSQFFPQPVSLLLAA